MNHKARKTAKWIELAIVVWTIVFVLSLTVMAATTTDTSNGLQLSVSSEGDVTVSKSEDATSTTWTIVAKGTDGACGTTNTKTVTFTIKNTDTTRAVEFVISVSSTGDTGTTPSGTQTLSANTELSSFTATSGEGASASETITITITGIKWESLGTTVTTTVKPAAGGTIKVDDTEVTTRTEYKKLDSETYALTAIPDDGYEFYGWMSATGPITTDGATSYTYQGQSTATLWPLFIKTGSAVYYIKDASPRLYYAYLDEAIAAAGDSGTVVVGKDGTAYHSDSTQNSFNIPSGVTLLIPFDSANTVVTNTAGDNLLHAYDTTVTARSQYRKLTMGADTKITVAAGGAISIGSKLANQFIGQVGPYGAIYMEEGSNITVQSGGYLYAWGYIFHGEEGSGTVTVESGGTVYEPLSTMDYPGSASLVSNLSTGNVFPMRSYSIRNVEVTMTLNSGAKEYGFACLYGSNSLVGTNPLYVLLIANGSVNGETPVFQNSGTITKSYEDSRMHMVIDGNLTLNSLIVEVAKSTGPVSISSSSTSGFYIPSCWDVEAKSGTTTLNDNVIMCEGSTFTISNGAVVDTSGNNVYVLDADNDPGAVVSTNGCSIDVQDVHGKYYTNVPNDAVLDINGTLITSGGFYTSAAGACITSSEGGGVIQVSGTSTSETVKVKNTNAYTEVAINAAWLKNEDGTYVLTGEEGTGSYYYAHGLWHTEEPKWANGTCTVCGAEFNIYGANIKTGDGLDMFFYVNKTDVLSGNYYAVVTKTFAGDHEDVVLEIPYSDWESYDDSLLRFCFDDISAKEMTDEITVVIYNSDDTVASNTWYDSVYEYAIRILNRNKESDDYDQKLEIVLVDMLEYGAAAQEYFGYNVEDEAKLANVGIAGYTGSSTWTPPEGSDTAVVGTNYVGTTVSASNNLVLTFYFNISASSDLTAYVTYTDHYGNSQKLEIKGTDFYVRSETLCGVDVTGLSVASGCQQVSCVVKNSTGEIVANAEDSVQGYVARQIKAGTDKAVFARLMMFVQSAYAYFH